MYSEAAKRVYTETNFQKTTQFSISQSEFESISGGNKNFLILQGRTSWFTACVMPNKGVGRESNEKKVNAN